MNESIEDETGESFELPKVDLGHGIAVGGILRADDVAALVELPKMPAPGESRPIRRNLAGSPVLLIMIGVFFAVIVAVPKLAAAPENPGGSIATCVIVGFVLPWVGWWAWEQYQKKLPRPALPDRRVRYVFQEECFYELEDQRLQQYSWRDPKIWRSETMLGLQDGRIVVGVVVAGPLWAERLHAIPRRFCANDEAWRELNAWFYERVSAVQEVSVPEGYDGAGQFEAPTPQGSWTQETAAGKVLAASEKPYTADEAFRAVGLTFSRRILLVGSATVAALIGLAIVTSGGLRGFLFSLGISTALVILSMIDSHFAAKRTVRKEIQVNWLRIVARETCLELVGEDYRALYRWETLRQGNTTDNLLALVTNSDFVIPIPRRLFTHQEWRRLVERVAELPRLVR